MAFGLCLSGEKKSFVAETTISKGSFELRLPKDAPIGIYHLVYGLPEEDNFIEILYNGREDIRLFYHADSGVDFLESEENRCYSEYQTKMEDALTALEDVLSKTNTDDQAIKIQLDRIEKLQERYEAAAKDLMVLPLIKAGRPYLPERPVSKAEYRSKRRTRFLKKTHAKDPLLSAASFLKTHAANFAYRMMPDGISNKADYHKAIEANIAVLTKDMAPFPKKKQASVLYHIWQIAFYNNMSELANSMAKKHLLPILTSTGETQKKEEVERVLRLELGQKAPNFSWENAKGDTHDLENLSSAPAYVLIFWSSTCGHCLDEIPEVHEALKQYPNVKTIALGLEESYIPWTTTITELPDFEHGITLERWQSMAARTYAVNRTPSYFLLGPQKHINAKPENGKALLADLRALLKED